MEIARNVIIISALLLLGNFVKGDSFDQRNFVVWFDPFVATTEIATSYNVDTLLPMISKIATKFSKIMIRRIDFYGENTDYTQTLIPLAVATFNANRQQQEQPPLEVFITFDMKDPDNMSKINFTKIIADKANQIFPGTVKKLYFEPYDLSNEASLNPATYLSHVQSFLKGSEYELGLDVYFGSCMTSNETIPSYLTPSLSYVTHVFFSEFPLQEAVTMGPELYVPLVTKMYSQCIRIMKKYYREISVGFRSGWAGSMIQPNVTEHNRNLVTYWERMNDWATKSNSTIVVMEAFDNPFKFEKLRYMGWWRLIQNASYYHSSQYVFEEKKPLWLDHTIDRNESIITTPTNTIGTTSIILIVVGIVSVISILSLVAIIVRFRNTNGQKITNRDLKEFFKGTSRHQNGIHQSTSNPDIQKTAYKKVLELPKNCFKIDRDSTLGTGTFAAVYRGSILKDQTEISVAVKTTKISCPSTTIKGILSEIKVLSYLGKHDNIVGILGAYTKELTKGKICLFLELCSLGSLESYLRKEATQMDDVQEDELSVRSMVEYICMEDIERSSLNSDTCNANDGENIVIAETNEEVLNEPEDEFEDMNITSKKSHPEYADFYRWSSEIAGGMAFLASKKVVHADLATRNVLLTLDKRAKITDFGLSRRLYDYTNYVKTGQEPLPWRWMSPEALRRMEFNEKTDVWSYGVTICEIYSLGDKPFEGISWSTNFSSQLTRGLRLEEPRFNSNNMYGNILRCWNVDPSQRPTFDELKAMLQ